MLNRSTMRPYAAATSPSRLRFFVTPVEDGARSEEGKAVEEPKFPANTPVKDMTADQRAEYNLHQARKHEDRVKSFGDWTPEKIAQLEQERDSLRAKTLTDSEKAIEDAREEGRSEVRPLLAQERVKVAFEKALNGRIPDAGALLDLDRSKFAKADATADIDAIRAWVEANSTESASGPQKRNIDLGQGRERGTNSPAKGVGAGAELFDNKRTKPTIKA